MNENEYVTMKEIGAELGMTSHQVGKLLKMIGLRSSEGRPSDKAFNEGYVAQKFAANGFHYLWSWSRTKTLRALEQAGHASKV